MSLEEYFRTGRPDVEYWRSLSDELRQYPSNPVLKERERELREYCIKDTFRKGDTWRSPSFALWSVVEVTTDGIATFVHRKHPDKSCKIRWDSCSLQTWALIERGPETVEPTTDVLPCGAIRVCVGERCGIVSSWHLVEPKIHQLRQAASRQQPKP